MHRLIGGNGRHGGPDEAGRVVLEASTSDTSDTSSNAILSHQAPPRARLSTGVYLHNPVEIEVLIARIIHANRAVGVHALSAASVVANAGR